MNFKNLSIIFALLSFELKVFSIPINDDVSENGLSALEISESEISDFEAVDVNDELTTVEVAESSFKDSDNDNDTELETTEVPTDSMDDLPCSGVQNCIDWIKQSNDTAVIEYGLTSDILDYLSDQYKKEEEKIEKFQQDFEAIDYGMKVDVNGHKMTVDIKGEEHNTTIVVLPGLSLINPVMFYKNIT